MLDIKFIRENAKEVQKKIATKGSKIDIEELLTTDEKRRKLITKLDELRAEHKKSEGRSDEAIKAKSEIQELETESELIKEKCDKLVNSLPNLPLDDVPIGKDEKDNLVLRDGVIQKPKFDFVPKDYLELAKKLDLIDIERAAKVSGSRFGYLKNQAVLLEFALVNLAMKIAGEENFIPIIPPVLVRGGTLEELGYDMENYYSVSDERCPKCNHAISWRDEIFCEECKATKKRETSISEGAERLKCHNPECGELTRLTSLYLVGTAEHSIVPMHGKETLEEKDLPKRYIAFSTAFRREAGSYGKDMKGILRVHQFDKVEMVSITKPEDSEKEHEFLLSMSEKLMQALKIPYRVVALCTGDLSKPSAKTYDIESWLPGSNEYRETHSISNTTDFQARRLGIKYKDVGGKSNYAHILNGTAFAIGRTLIALIENYQERDGSVRIPEVLQKHVPFKVIQPRKE